MEEAKHVLEMLEKKDGDNFYQVAKSIEDHLFNVNFSALIKENKQPPVDYLTDCGLPILAYEYLQYLQRCDFQDPNVKLCYEVLLNVIARYSDQSAKFAIALGFVGALDYLIQQLTLNDGTVSKQTVRVIIMILHNSVKHPENHHIYHEKKFVEVVLKFVTSDTSEEIAILIFFSISYVANPYQISNLEVPEKFIKWILNVLSQAMKQTPLHIYMGFTAQEIIVGLSHLSASTIISHTLLVNGFLDLLEICMIDGNAIEKECAVNARDSLTESACTPISSDGIMPETSPSLTPSGLGTLSINPFRASEVRSPAASGCNYQARCVQFQNSLEIDNIYMQTSIDKCFCKDCLSTEGGLLTYSRGDPPKTYAVPVGWCRFGLAPPPRAYSNDLKAFDNWHRAYHGTRVNAIKGILKCGELLRAGDKAMDGIELKPCPGHFDGIHGPTDFNYKRLFVTPSIIYAGSDTYAWPVNYLEPGTGRMVKARVALQVLIEPTSYEVKPQTLNATYQIDPNFSNYELEWVTGHRACCILYGLLIKLEDYAWF